MSSIVALTGGIGSGKSVVSRILRIKGYEVIDTDAHAKAIMDSDDDIKQRLTAEIDNSVVHNGVIDRRRLAEIVFADSEKLALLNSIVHGKVRDSLLNIANQRDGVLFVETAIFYQSGLNRMADAEWRVESPLELRISRVMARNSLRRDEVIARIASQKFIPNSDEPQPSLTIIYNDEQHLLLPQINEAIAVL